MIKSFPRWLQDLLISLGVAVLFGAAFAAFSAGTYLLSWLAYAIVLWVSIFFLLVTWRRFGAGKSLAVVMLVAFFLRLIIAVFVSVGLPLWGYDNPVNNAGYLYSDAFTRDQAAFQLATSGNSLFSAFTHPTASDQYGGLLFLSAFIYKTLSPDAIRPVLISILAAFFMTLGLAFLWEALRKYWSEKIALWAIWLFALYPESLLLGSSQMREPFLIGLTCIAIWAVFDWKETPRRSLIIALACVAVCCLFSVPVGGVYFILLFAYFLLNWAISQTKLERRIAGLVLFAALILGGLAGSALWLKSTLYYDSFMTVQQSGWIMAIVEKYGSKIILPFTTLYGLVQPVLPAAIIDPAIPIWKAIAILRAGGWYFVLPVLLYGFIAAFKEKDTSTKRALILFNLAFIVWLLVSSARAGGDQWDNPRYRLLLLPWMSLLVSWAIDNYRKTHSPWLWRWVAVLAVFFFMLLNLYLYRFFTVGIRLQYENYLVILVSAWLVILAGGWIWDKTRRKGSMG